MKSAVLLVLVVAALSSGCKCSGEKTKVQNVVIFYVDTLRADHVGAYGYKLPTTPFIDQLAANGVLFEDSYTPSPWTYPATASLLTGLNPAAHGAMLPGEIRSTRVNPHGVTRIDKKITTIAHLAGDAGIKSALFAANGYLGFGLEEGFDKYNKNRKLNADKQIDLALDFMNSLAEEERFLMVVHFMDLHHPTRATKEARSHFPAVAGLSPKEFDFFRRWRVQFAGKNTDLKSEEFLKYKKGRIASYDAAMRGVDKEIKRFVESLGDRRKDTLVIFTADHGEEFWDHFEIEKEIYDDPRGLYGVTHGHTLFEELHRVPLIFNLPSKLDAAKVKGRVLLNDVLPTLVDLMELKDNLPREGISLVSHMDGKKPVPTRKILLDEICFGKPKQGILDGDYKFIRSSDEPSLLFNIKDDPLEKKNLLKENPEKAVQLKGELEELYKQSEAVGNNIRGCEEEKTLHHFSKEDVEALKALGYIEGEEEEADEDEDASSGDTKENGN